MRWTLLACLAVLFCAACGNGVADSGEAQQPSTTTAAFDWPQWRGPNRDGLSKETGLLKEWPDGGPKLLWNSRDVNGKKGIGQGYSSVSVAGGRLFTMGDQKGKGYVFALDASTGKGLWATAISGADGDGPRCTPTVDGDRLYALSRQGDLACLDVKDGKVIWQVNFPKDFGGRAMASWHYCESPLVDGGKLIVTPGGDKAALVGLNKATGEVLWKTPVPNAHGAGYSSPVVAEAGGVRQYVTFLGSCVVGVSADGGRLLWRYDRVANGTANVATPIVDGDLVFCSTAYGTGAALLKLIPDGKGGVAAKEQYFLSGNKLQNHHGGMIRVGEHIYGGHGHGAGLPFCVHMKTGKLAWGPERGAGDGSAAVAYADGHLYFRYENNTMALIEATPTAYRLKSQFDLPRGTGTPGWQHPVVANGRLYVRGNDVVLCYDVKQN